MVRRCYEKESRNLERIAPKKTESENSCQKTRCDEEGGKETRNQVHSEDDTNSGEEVGKGFGEEVWEESGVRDGSCSDSLEEKAP